MKNTKNNREITNAIMLAKVIERIESVKGHMDLKIEPVKEQINKLEIAFESHKTDSLTRHNTQENKIQKNSVKIASIKKESGIIATIMGTGVAAVLAALQYFKNMFNQ